MVEHMGNMYDLFCAALFKAAQDQIIVLTSLIASPEASQVLDKRAPIYAKMGNHVMTIQEILIEWAFKIRILAQTVLVGLVFIGKHYLAIRIHINIERNRPETVNWNNVVVVEEGNEIASQETTRCCCTQKCARSPDGTNI